jgi:hypothetical protein
MPATTAELPMRRRMGLRVSTSLPGTRDGLELLDRLVLFRNRVGGWSADIESAERVLAGLREL